MTWFYSPKALELRVGPGGFGAEEIRFQGGFAEVALSDPDRDEKLKWLKHAQQRHAIENLGEDKGGLSIPGTSEFVCHLCGKGYDKKAQLSGHFLTHRKAGDWVPPAV